jgi:hypothetical protein
MNPGIPIETLTEIVRLRLGERATYSQIHSALPQVSYPAIVRICQGKSRAKEFEALAKELGYRNDD